MAKKKKTNIVLYVADIWRTLPDDAVRKGRSTPLGWGKFRSPADTSETGQQYQLRRQAIKSLPNGFAVLGVYDELLVNYGFNKTAALRGWVINHNYQAATTAQIAQAIGVSDLKFLKYALRALVAVGLLQKVRRPDIEAAIRQDKTIRLGPWSPPDKSGLYPTPDDANDPDKGKEEGKGNQTGEVQSDSPGVQSDSPEVRSDSSGVQPDSSEVQSDSPEQKSGKPHNPQQSEQPDSSRCPDGVRPAAGKFQPASGQPPDSGGQTLTRDMRRETADEPTASASPPPSADGNGADTTDKKTASATPQPPDVPQGDGRPPDTPQGDRKTEDVPPGDEKPLDVDTGAQEATDTTAFPTTTPPNADAEADEPTEADHQGEKETSEVFDHTTAGIDSVDVLVRNIGKALYPTREDLAVEGRKAYPPQQADEFEARERGVLTVAWSAVMAVGLTPAELFQLRERAVKEAERIRKKKTRKPKGCPWRYWLNKHMENAVGSVCWAKAQRAARADASGPP